MEIITILEFGNRTKDWVEITIDITPFENEGFNCACGNSHIVKDLKDGLIRQLTRNRIVLRNKNCKTVSCFEITGTSEFIPLYCAILS